MSYNDVVGDKFAVSPMALDIEAIMSSSMYGERIVSSVNIYSIENGRFSGTNRMQTIVDNGTSIDTFDLTGFGSGVRIDLRESLTLENGIYEFHHDATHSAISSMDINDRLTVVGEEWIYLARGTKIENATGTHYNDAIIGNDLSNILTGNGGNDTLVGGDGANHYRFAGAFGQDIISGYGDSNRKNESISIQEADGGYDRINGSETYYYHFTQLSGGGLRLAA